MDTAAASVAPSNSVIADAWAVSDVGKESGHTYECTVRFSLPAVDSIGDAAAQALRDEFLRVASSWGARAGQAEVVSLTGMRAG
jgi:hypothetical protein